MKTVLVILLVLTVAGWIYAERRAMLAQRQIDTLSRMHKDDQALLLEIADGKAEVTRMPDGEFLGGQWKDNVLVTR